MKRPIGTMSSTSDNDSNSASLASTAASSYEDVTAPEALPGSAPRGETVDVEQAALFLRALSNENRLALLNLQMAGEQTVSYLADALDMRQPAVSQQLGRLREANLVDFRREGKTVYYRVASARARAFLPLIRGHFSND